MKRNPAGVELSIGPLRPAAGSLILSEESAERGSRDLRFSDRQGVVYFRVRGILTHSESHLSWLKVNATRSHNLKGFKLEIEYRSESVGVWKA